MEDKLDYSIDSEMFAMAFEDDPVLLKAAMNGLAILEGTEADE